MFFGQKIIPDIPYQVNERNVKGQILSLTNAALDISCQEAQLYVKFQGKQILVSELNRQKGPKSVNINIFLSPFEKPNLISKKGTIHLIGFYQSNQNLIKKQTQDQMQLQQDDPNPSIKRSVANDKPFSTKQKKKKSNQKKEQKTKSLAQLLQQQINDDDQQDDQDDNYQEQEDQQSDSSSLDQQKQNDQEIPDRQQPKQNKQDRSRSSLRKKVKSQHVNQKLQQPKSNLQQFKIPNKKPQFLKK